MKKNFIYWFRWVAVLPAGLFFGFLVTSPLHWFLRPFESTITPFVIPLVFILVGVAIAPKYKFQTSIILTILYVSGLLIEVFIIAPRYQYYQSYNSEPNGRILGFLGSFLGLYIAWRKSRVALPITPPTNDGS